MKTYLNINSIQDKSIPGSKLEESYVSQENGKGLSTNDFTDILKNKLLSLNNYDDSELNEKLLKLEQNLNSILGEGSTEAIENFNEIISFLSGIEDSESLDNIIAAIELQISDKQDKINDLQKIREGASKGETALQDIPEEYITEDELENKGYLTEHQDITPEILQNENEVAIKVGNNTSGYTTINYSKFSNDLTGRIEATPEEFTFRPSAGDKSIRDESALIKRIKGNTIVWNQLINNALNNSLYGKTAWYVRQGAQNAEIVGNYVVINCVSGVSSAPTLSQIVNFKKNHKYLIHLQWESTTEKDSYGRVLRCEMNNDVVGGTAVDYFTDVVSLNTLTGDKYIIKTAVDDAKFLVIAPRQCTNDIGQYLKIGVNLFDLTQMFGAGNEPTTVEEFKALFPNNYYDYNAGELVSMTSNGLFANGFNQWDEDWVLGEIYNGSLTSGTRICSKNFIKIVPNQVYTSNQSLLISLYDSEKNFIPYDGNGDFLGYQGLVDLHLGSIREGKFPIEAEFIKFKTYSSYGTTYKNDICINLSHTGVRNGEYEPYWDATKDLSIIQKYFPNGMRGAGSIYDEISFDEATQKWVAIQRVGSVDLGSLAWIINTSTLNYKFFHAKLTGIKQAAGYGKKANAICSALEIAKAYPTNDVEIPMGSLMVYYDSGQYLYVHTSHTDVASFKTAMTGVMLCYELAEPIITTIEEPTDLSYRVGDFGIEKMLSDSFSAPFKADIVYQFNAVDRIRDNSRNIEKLNEKTSNKVDKVDGKVLSTNDYDNEEKAQVERVRNGSAVVDNTLSEVKADSPKPVSGAGIASAIEAASNNLKARGYIYMGVATPTTTPDVSGGKVFYLAAQAGEYSNFGYTLPTDALTSLEWNGERWSAIRIADLVTPEEVAEIDEEITQINSLLLEPKITISGKAIETTGGLLLKISGSVDANLNPLKLEGIKIVGRNLFDKNAVIEGNLNSSGNHQANSNYQRYFYTSEFMRVLPSTEYYFFNVSNNAETYGIAWYREDKTFISISSIKNGSKQFAVGTRQSPSAAAYVRVTCRKAYVDNCCVSINDPSLNGIYSPYAESSILADIASIFSSGLYAIDSVADEIDIAGGVAVQRCGIRDYEAGDENNTAVITNNVKTVYALSSAVETRFTPQTLLLKRWMMVGESSAEATLTTMPIIDVNKIVPTPVLALGNKGSEGVTIVGDNVVLSQSGFGLAISGKLCYFSSGSGNDTTYTVADSAKSKVLVIDTTKIFYSGGKNNKYEDCVIVRESNELKPTDVVIAYSYFGSPIKLFGVFADFFSNQSSNGSLKEEEFTDAYLAFYKGIMTTDTSRAWQGRFTLAQVSDVHAYFDALREALRVSNGKVAGFVNTGDDSNGDSDDDSALVNADLTTMQGIIASTSLPYIPNIGNHDYYGNTKQEYFDRICAPLTNVVWGNAAQYRTYGYIDLEDDSYKGKYRIIMLDPMDYDDSQFKNPYAYISVVFSQEQIDWLIATLRDAALKGYKIITTMHYSFGDNTVWSDTIARPDCTYYQDAFMIPDIIDAMQKKSTLNKTYTDSAGLNDIVINENFDDVADFEYICHLFGHIHSRNVYQCQSAVSGKKYDMLMLGEISLCRNATALSKIYRTPNTNEDMSFSVLAIDPDEEAIYRIAYGAYKEYDNPDTRRVEKFKYRFNN